jgi:hypothetical protein
MSDETKRRRIASGDGRFVQAGPSAIGIPDETPRTLFDELRHGYKRIFEARPLDGLTASRRQRAEKQLEVLTRQHAEEAAKREAAKERSVEELRARLLEEDTAGLSRPPQNRPRSKEIRKENPP